METFYFKCIILYLFKATICRIWNSCLCCPSLVVWKRTMEQTVILCISLLWVKTAPLTTLVWRSRQALDVADRIIMWTLCCLELRWLSRGKKKVPLSEQSNVLFKSLLFHYKCAAHSGGYSASLSHLTVNIRQDHQCWEGWGEVAGVTSGQMSVNFSSSCLTACNTGWQCVPLNKSISPPVSSRGA